MGLGFRGENYGTNTLTNLKKLVTLIF